MSDLFGSGSLDLQLIGQWMWRSGSRILLILALALLAARLLHLLTRHLTRRIQALDGAEDSPLDKRTETVFVIVRSTGFALIFATALVMVLQVVGVQVAPLLASVGIAGLALGLGAQTLVKDMISGLFILLENQYRVGDTVTVAGISGTVEDLTLRTTALRDLYGTLHIIPNGEIRTVSNQTRDWSRAVVEVGIPYEQDVKQALAVLEGVGQSLQADETTAACLLEAPEVSGIEGLDDYQVRLRLMVKTRPGQQLQVQRLMRRLIKERLPLATPRQEVVLLGRGQGQS